MPQNLLETQNFLALNAFNSPENYSSFPLPDTGGPDTVYIGEFGNGSNCGRWAEVTIGAYCTGTNDGAPNEPFCRGTGAAWIDDSYSGAVLDMLVADCCPDANAWCRDSRYHLDLATASLNLFVKNSVAVGDMNPDHWNNQGNLLALYPGAQLFGRCAHFFHSRRPNILAGDPHYTLTKRHSWRAAKNGDKLGNRQAQCRHGTILYLAEHISRRVHLYHKDLRRLQFGD